MRVYYNANGATGGLVPTDSNNYIFGDKVQVSQNQLYLIRTGYAFNGWNSAADGSGISFWPSNTYFYMGHTDWTLYAQWLPGAGYTLSYNANGADGGSVPPDNPNHLYYDIIELFVGTIYKTGYRLVYWNTKADGTGTDFDPFFSVFTGITRNTTLYAKWALSIYKIAYAGNGQDSGLPPTDLNNYHYLDNAVILGNTGGLVKAGSVFSGWNTEAGGGGTPYNPGDTVTITSGLFLWAQWALPCMVTYEGNGSTGGTVPVDPTLYKLGDPVTVLSNTGSLVKAGKYFVGWNTDPGGGGTDYNGGKVFTISNGVVLYAKWVSSIYYTVTYNGNGADGGSVPVDSSHYGPGNRVPVQRGGLYKALYHFTSWNTKADGSGTSYNFGASFAIYSNVILYAQWVSYCIVTYNGNGFTNGTVPVDYTTHNPGDTVATLYLGSVIKTGSNFVNWNTKVDGSGISYNPTDTFIITTAVTLYAQWVTVARLYAPPSDRFNSFDVYIEFWYKRNDDALDTDDFILFKRSSSYSSFWFHSICVAGYNKFYLEDSTEGHSEDTGISIAVSDHTWHKIKWAPYGDCYMDGVVVGSTSYWAGYSAPGRDMDIISVDSGKTSHCSLDEIKVFNVSYVPELYMLTVPFNQKFNYAPTEKFKIKCYFKLNDLIQEPYEIGIITKDFINFSENLICDDFSITYSYYNGAYYFFIYIGDDSSQTNFIAIPTGISLSDTDWHAIEWDYNNGYNRFYLDGEDVTYDSQNQYFISQHNYDLHFGRIYPGDSGHFLLDEVQFIDLTRTPVEGTIKFDYSYGESHNYNLFLDEPGKVLDAPPGEANFPYGFLMDGASENQAVVKSAPEEIGYRYRMYQLQHSSVFNSPGTLNFNEFPKPANNASIADRRATLNHFNKVFSPEFLYDTYPLPSSLGDSYLDSTRLDPVLKLQPGTPTFQQTFSYQPDLIYQEKIQDIRKNHKLLLYSDLLQKEYISGEAVNLSSICDSDKVAFKTRIKEEIPDISECPPWILFDTVETKTVNMTIPGEYRGVPNLRVSGKLLRENFILRDVEPTGTALFTYSFIAPGGSSTPLVFNLPKDHKMFIDDEWVDFPTLPVVDRNDHPATPADITCTINKKPYAVTSLDPILGIVTVADYSEKVYGEIITLTADDAANKFIQLPGFLKDPTNISLSVVHGTSQFLYKDFQVIGRNLVWFSGDLVDLAEGDQLQLIYDYAYPANAEIEFTYYISNSMLAQVIDRDRSRIMDDKYVFAALCPDIEVVNMKLYENYSFLDDNSDGIKLSFFNKDILTIEEHVFSGPVFESYEAVEDEIGVPDNFPGALVKIPNPMSLSNPLNYSADYGFLNDSLVRFRKKTYQELLPDRSFRSMKLVEMLPV